MRLLEATRANFGQIFMLYDDPESFVQGRMDPFESASPCGEVTDDLGIRHRLWKVKDPAVISDVCAFMQNRDLFIADGHHRYRTALEYLQARERSEPDPPARWRMMTFVNMHDPGLVVLPTHRVVSGLDPGSTREFLKSLDPRFEVRETASKMDTSLRTRPFS